jgi:TolA-binding protein
MTEPRERLFKAWADAMARTKPELNPHSRQRVLAAHAKRSRPSAFPLGYRWGLGGLAAAIAVAVLMTVRVPVAPSFQVAGRTGTGEVGAWLTTEPGHPLPLHFSDGTRVLLGQGSRARVSGVTRGGARIELASGHVDAEVAHLPGANWTFGAGPFEVAVTGTRLDVSWAPDAGKFELSVSQGSVLVRGPFIQGEQEVRAGQVCRVDMTRRLMELGQLGEVHARTERTPAEVPPPPGSAAPEPEAADANAPVASSLGAPRAVSADAWLEAARAARLAGHPDEERAALLACRRRAPGQAAAAQAAYLLGRASGAAEAARWFETYLREQPQGLLAREAAGRLIESYRASGNKSAAQTAASRYLARYPHGPHASLARQALTTRSD